MPAKRRAPETRTRRTAKGAGSRPPSTPGRPVRLHKVLADAGFGSRRYCEDLIASGQVKVNGRTVEEFPCLVNPGHDRITVAGKPVTLPDQQVYVMFFKPRHTMTTMYDPGGRRTVADLVRHPSGARLFPVGRLDYDTSGLILLTNDGRLANTLAHPRYGIEKTYRAVVGGLLTDEDAERIQQGLYLAVRRYGQTRGAARTSPARIKIVRRERGQSSAAPRSQPTGRAGRPVDPLEPELRGEVGKGDRSRPGPRTVLDITLTEGRNREVRRLLAQVNCRVKKLLRIRIGPIELKGLRAGQWRDLTAREVQALRRAVSEGERRAAQTRKTRSEQLPEGAQ